VSALAVGSHRSCAVRGGALSCWGIESSTPVGVTGLSSGVSAIEAGAGHGCALTADGSTRCWGANDYGQLGDDTGVGTRLTPVAVVGLSSGVSTIDSDEAHTCSVTTGGAVQCWGANGFGQLGDGTTDDRATPVGVVGLSSGVSAVATGGGHSCALTTSGAVKCWGFNFGGQVGDGTTTARLTPVDVKGLSSGVSAIAAGETHALALTSANNIVAWGANDSGATTVPGGLSSPLAIAASWHYSAAVANGAPSAAVPRLSAPRWNGNSFSVSLSSQPGVSYILEYKNALTDSSWTALPAVTGTGSTLTLNNTSATGSRRFYRVRAQ